MKDPEKKAILGQQSGSLTSPKGKHSDSAHTENNKGLSLLKQGKALEALPFLQKAVQTDPTVKGVVRLGECFEALGDVESALPCYRAALGQRTTDAKLWVRYGRLLQLNGQTTEAEQAYRSALKANPKESSATIALARLLWNYDTLGALQILDSALSQVDDDLVARTQILSVQLVFREWAERIECGLMPYHATSLTEVFFQYAQTSLTDLYETSAKLVKQNPENSWARMTHALATFASGNIEKSQQHFAVIDDETFSPMAQTIRFDKRFFEGLRSADDTQLTAGLPEVISSKDGEFNDSDILYMSCNDTYFDAYTKPLLRSLSEQGPGTQVHIHLMDSSEQHTEEALQFCTHLRSIQTAITVERPDLTKASPATARSYFHAIRFIRLYHHALHYDQPLWMMDVDGLFNRSPTYIFEQLSDADISMRVRPGRLEPWNQFNACLLGVRATPQAIDYLRSIAHYISHFHGAGVMPWGLDQLAMYACFVDAERRGSAPALHLLDDKALDYSYLPEGILWCSSGATKATVLARSQGEDPEASPYQKAFMRYQGDDDAP